MEIQPSTMSVFEYCRSLERHEIQVNPKYQRSPKVWPPAARSFLIETILLGYPIPKLFLHQRLEVRSRRELKEVVDGQQRTRAIRDFYENEFRLSTTLELEEAKGKKLEQLDDDLQRRFLQYGLNFDVFVATTEKEVREVFRRMNSFTVPLNDEEQRHAIYQGPFKWFIHKLTGDYAEAMLQAGVFTDRQVIRMVDAKLMTEVAHALLNGISTTSKRRLNDLYRSRDSTFPEEDELDARMRGALDRFLSWPEIVDTALTKTYNVYALLLACAYVAERVEVLASYAPPGELEFTDRETIVENLTALAEQLELDQPEPTFKPFVKAAAERTNVAAQRGTRFRWFCRALSDTVP